MDHAAVVELLLNVGVDIDEKGEHGDTMALWAARNRHETTLRLLLTKVANMEAKNEYNKRPAILAEQNGLGEVVRRPRETGAGIQAEGR